MNENHSTDGYINSSFTAYMLWRRSPQSWEAYAAKVMTRENKKHEKEKDDNFDGIKRLFHTADECNVKMRNIHLYNNSNHRVGWAIKTTKLEGGDKATGYLDPKENIVLFLNVETEAGCSEANKYSTVVINCSVANN